MMFHHIFSVALTVLLGCLAHVAESAQISRLSGILISIEGQITQSDIRTLEDIFAGMKSPRIMNTMVFVNSRGGDWHAAMKIGRLLRREIAQVSVLDDKHCLSACVLLLAGAPMRVLMPKAQIGIHRPYSNFTGSISVEDAQKNYRILETSTRIYLQEMNMPTSIFEAMISVPPEKIRVLTDRELTDFRLGQNDPVAQEIEDAGEAKRYKISKQDYLSRKARIDQECSPLLSNRNEKRGEIRLQRTKEYASCHNGILEGKR